MSIMHVFTVADARAWVPHITQFRFHVNVPWDEAQGLYLDRENLKALLKLARHANGSNKLQGRVFDVMAAVRSARLDGPYRSRDMGPYAVITPSSVWSRSELETHLNTWTDHQWTEARNFARFLSDLSDVLPE